jgi:hypothetical protein
MEHGRLQETFDRIVQSGAADNSAYRIILQDYINFHLILVIGGAVCAFFISIVTGFAWKRFIKNVRAKPNTTSKFELRAYLLFTLVGSASALIILMLVAINLSTVLAPQDGFEQAVADIAARRETRATALHEALNLWLLSGDQQVPAMLQQAVRDRLSWQLPKMVICGVLFATLSVIATLIWNALIKRSRTSENMAQPKQIILTLLGILALPAMFILLIMTLANGEASFAPITITLLSG